MPIRKKEGIHIKISLFFFLIKDCIVSKFPRASGTENFPIASDIKYNYLKDGDVISTEGATIRLHLVYYYCFILI